MKPNLVQRQRVMLWLGVSWLGLSGCVGERTEQSTKADKDQVLTAEIAKKALLEMDLEQIPPGVIVPEPKDEPIKLLGTDEIALGIWKCNLGKKTFEVTAKYPNAPRHKFNHVMGVFRRTPDGKWVAKVKYCESAE